MYYVVPCYFLLKALQFLKNHNCYDYYKSIIKAVLQENFQGALRAPNHDKSLNLPGWSPELIN